MNATSDHDHSAREQDARSLQACVACTAVAHGDVAARRRRPELPPNAAEAITDSLGFCADHAAQAEQERDDWPKLASLLRAATERTLGMLADLDRQAERLCEASFARERDCPLCRLHEHRLTRCVHHLADARESGWPSHPLCQPHYRRTVYAVQAPALPRLAQMQIRTLRWIVAAIGAPARESAQNARGGAGVGAPPLDVALRLLAGADWPIIASEVRADARDCVVCAEIVAGEQSWLRAVKTVAQLGQDLWTALATCPVHVAVCARRYGAEVATITARHALGMELASVELGLSALERSREDRVLASRSVFYRRQSPAFVLGQERKMIASLLPCPGCRCAEVAQQRGIVRASNRLTAGARASTPPDPLCMKHFASIYALVSDRDARARLVAGQIVRLQDAGRRLAVACDSADASLLGEAIRTAVPVWRTARRRLLELHRA